MGEVYLARADGTGSAAGDTLVLKRILPHLTQNPRFLRLFLDETRIASRLVHPNIARIFELGEAEGTWFVAMEHVDGLDLREVMKRTREQQHHMPVEIAVAIAVEVAKGLHHAHIATDAQGRSLHVVHRDISPHNVLVGRNGAVKLIDFGVARAANKSIHTATGVLKGKFPYMSPEQAQAKPVDARTDVFALGIVLWEMLCARYLFRGKTDAATLKLVRAADVQAPSQLRDDVPEALDLVLLKALRREARDRYQTAEAFREALAQVGSNLAPADLVTWLKNYDDVPGLDDDALESERSSNETQLESHERPTVVESTRRQTRSMRSLDSNSDLFPISELTAVIPQKSTNLGPQATSFVGRVAELADLHQLFRQGARLISLLGHGGTGKTRLALQLGSQLVTHYQSNDEKGRKRGGVWFVDLTAARTKDDACAAVARVLEVPLAAGDAVAQLGHALAVRGETLIILDNFEQLVPQAEELLGAWLGAAPKARFIVTSSELLSVAHETVFEVPPLRMPQSERDARTSEAVQLFIERSRDARPGWEPSEEDLTAIADVCRQLDGMPLAIELAAARMGVWSPQQLATRLPRRFDVLVSRKGATEKQATLRGAIDWSWNNLSPTEAQTLARLSVFRGGFLPEAAESVVSEPGTTEQLFALRSKSLVRVYYPTGDEAAPRYGLFETIRAYAWEKLTQLPEYRQVLRRHARWYLTTGGRLAAKAESSREVLDVLDQERENLLSLFERAIAEEDGAKNALAAIQALDPLLTTRGPFGAHLKMLDDVVTRVADDPELLVQAMETRSRTRLARGRALDAMADVLQAEELAARQGDEHAQGRLWVILAMVDRHQGRRAEAKVRFERAIGVLKRFGDDRMRGRALSNLAGVLHENGDDKAALGTFNEALEVLRAAGDRRYEGVTLTNLGLLQLGLGMLKPARANYLAALSIHRELGSKRSEGITHMNLGELAVELEQPGQAIAHQESAMRLFREVGARRFEGHSLLYLSSLHQQYGEYDDAMKYLPDAIEVLREVKDQRFLGLALGISASVLALQGRLADAEAQMVEASDVLTATTDEMFLDALDLYRAHLEFGHVLQTRSERQGQALEERIRKRVARATQKGSDGRSLADRSEHVRAALRSLRGAMSDNGHEL